MNKQARNDLTSEQVREIFDYDYENGWLIKKTFRNGCPYNKPVGHKPICNGYGTVRIGDKKYYTHRVIWLWHKGTWPEHEIDHIDQNKINNRIENLRDVSASDNQHNVSIRKDNSSGYPGVYWDKQNEKYHARICVKNKEIFLGLYETKEDAFLAYQLAKIKYHPTSPTAQEYKKEIDRDDSLESIQY